MDKIGESGAVRNVGGETDGGFGRVTCDTEAKVDGLANQTAGAAKEP